MTFLSFWWCTDMYDFSFLSTQWKSMGSKTTTLDFNCVDTKTDIFPWNKGRYTGLNDTRVSKWWQGDVCVWLLVGLYLYRGSWGSGRCVRSRWDSTSSALCTRRLSRSSPRMRRRIHSLAPERDSRPASASERSAGTRSSSDTRSASSGTESEIRSRSQTGSDRLNLSLRLRVSIPHTSPDTGSPSGPMMPGMAPDTERWKERRREKGVSSSHPEENHRN